jgi:hypothetical protein
LRRWGKTVRTGYQAGFAAFTQNIENRSPLLGADAAGGQAQNFGDAHPGLEEGVDQELIPEAVSALAGGAQAADLLPGQVGDDTQGLREQCPARNEGPLRHSRLDKNDFGPTLLLVACGCQAQNAGQRKGGCGENWTKGLLLSN